MRLCVCQFECFDLCLYTFSLYHSNRSEKKHIKLPLDIEDAKQLGLVLGRYKEMYYVEVMSAVVLFYIL